ncbi:hypothetical protein GBA52_025894 [Prunus armeniaca]|nr:hypothetical protein GBA52_025894 [Prunus armeniaca]
MEMMMVKNEENTRRRRLSTVDREAQESRCVKRRRRDPAAVAVSCDNSQSEKHLPQKPADQTSATTTKRSSRFRGVSRFESETNFSGVTIVVGRNFFLFHL